MSEETGQRIADALEALVMLTQVLVSNEPEPEVQGKGLTVMTQQGPIEVR